MHPIIGHWKRYKKQTEGAVSEDTTLNNNAVNFIFPEAFIGQSLSTSQNTFTSKLI